MTRLRGHHLFCLPLFSGSGYDRDFTQNLAGVVAGLKAGEPLVLGEGQDSVCRACPHALPGGGCALGTENVAARDHAALGQLGLSPGEELSWEALLRRLGQVSQEGFRAVCGSCRWSREGLCSYPLLQRRAAGED